MIFNDVDRRDIQDLLSHHHEVPVSSLLYLINYAGLTDSYMTRNRIEITWDNIGNLMLYHKLYHELPKVEIPIYHEHPDIMKGVLLCKITNRDFIFSETRFSEDCAKYAEEYRRPIEEKLYPLVMPGANRDPLSKLSYCEILRGKGAQELNLTQEEIDTIEKACIDGANQLKPVNKSNLICLFSGGKAGYKQEDEIEEDYDDDLDVTYEMEEFPDMEIVNLKPVLSFD